MSETYEQYRERVIAAIRAELFTRWPPSTDAERAQLEANVNFFATQCSYEEAYAEAADPAEVATDEIDAAA